MTINFAQILSYFTLSSEIKIGDILTSLSILISATVLVRAWAKDRRDRDKETADKIRNASAKTLAKLDRWQELSLWFFQHIQPLFVETSEMLLKDFNVISARDFFWKKANETRAHVLDKILDEEIEIAYVELYSYHPTVRELFTNAIKELKEKEEALFNDFIESSQDTIKSYSREKLNYQSAMLGNDLRETGLHFSLILKEKTDRTLSPIKNFLIDIVSKSDKEILQKRDSLNN